MCEINGLLSEQNVTGSFMKNLLKGLNRYFRPKTTYGLISHYMTSILASALNKDATVSGAYVTNAKRLLAKSF